MVTMFGMSDAIGMVSLASVQNSYLDGRAYMECSADTEKMVDEEIRRIMKESYDKAYKLLSEHVELLDALAAHLIEKETITGKEFMQIYEELTGEKLKEAAPDEKRTKEEEAEEAAPDEKRTKEEEAEEAVPDEKRTKEEETEETATQE